MKIFFSLFVLFFLVFELQIPGLPNGVGSSALVLVLLVCAYILIPEKFNFSDSVFILKPIGLIHALIFIYVLIRMLIDGVQDFSFILAVLKAIVLFLAVIMCVSFRINFDLFNGLINIFFFNALVCFVAGSIPDILTVVKIFQSAPITTEASFIPYRNSFLSGSGYFTIGSAYGLAFLVYCYNFYRNESDNGVFLLKGFMIAAAGVFAARTAFVGVFFGLILILLKSPKRF